MVCGDSDSEPIVRNLKRAVGKVSIHTNSLAKDISSLEHAGRERDEAIHHINVDQLEIRNTIQNSVIPRIDQSETKLNNLTSKLETMHDSFTTGLTSAAKNVEHIGSQLGLVPPPHLSACDEQDAEDVEVAGCQSTPSTTEERLSKLESSIEFLKQRFSSLEEQVIKMANDVAAITDLAHLLNPAKEQKRDHVLMRDRTRALSTKKRAYVLCHSTPGRGHSASISSTASSGFGSMTGEDVILSDVEEFEASADLEHGDFHD